LKIPNPDAYLMPATVAEHENAVSENVAASLGRPVVAFPEQDHIAHLKTHLAYMVNPTLGANPLFQPTFMPVIVGHLREHIALWYMQTTIELAEKYTTLNLEDSVQQHEDAGDNRALDRLLANASTIVSEQAGAVFASMQQIIAQAQQMAAQFQAPQPMDPTQATLQVAQMQQQGKQQELAARQQAEQLKQQTEQQKAASDQQTEQMRLAAQQQSDQAKLQQSASLEQQREQLQMQLAALDQQMEQARISQAAQQHAGDIQAKLTMNEADNQTALTISQEKIEAGQSTNLENGTGIGSGV
ncbi:MAG: hypothetical protein KGH96_23765, partial [Sphingomonadales bacterium]|nr:hypothetical protein [Sphingomonadales bacterium]